MKRIISILILLLLVLKVNAQFSEKNAIYLTGGLNLGNFLGMNLNLNYILNNNYSFQAGISGLLREPKSKPEDFTSGLTGLFTLGLSNLLYYEEMDNYQILVGKIFKSNKASTTRFNIAGGIGYTYLTEAINWKPVTNYTIGENYTYDIIKHSTASFIIKPQVEFPFTRYFGITLSPMLQINKYRTYVGIEIGAMLGLLREKTNHNK
jgi:hypothetical protein